MAIPADNNSDIFALALADAYTPTASASLYVGANAAWDKDNSVEFSGTNPDYSDWDVASPAGIAMDHDGSFYIAALRRYNITEYAWDLDDPFVLKYVRVIDIFATCLGTYSGCG